MSTKALGRGDVDPFIVMDVMERARQAEAAGRSIIHMEVGQPGTGAPAGARKALGRRRSISRLAIPWRAWSARTARRHRPALYALVWCRPRSGAGGGDLRLFCSISAGIHRVVSRRASASAWASRAIPATARSSRRCRRQPVGISFGREPLSAGAGGSERP